MKEPDFGQGGLLGFWNSLTIQQRETLVKNLESFHALLGSMRNRGIVTADKNIQVITVIKDDPDVGKLMEVFTAINAPGMKLIDKRPLTKHTEV